MKLKRYSLNKWLLLAALLVSCIPFMLAQRTISGTITDEQTGEPLIGANVLVPNSGTGTATDFDGTFTLQLPEGATEIEVSYTGYASQTVDLSQNPSNVINLSLSSGEILDEVVVIGYGTVKREDATGAIQSVGTKDFNKGAINSPQELLAGKVAGVQITPPAAPGDGAVIRIRGGSSLSASNDPLIVIDGVPIENSGVSGSRNALNVINPNDIETFTVLKDASATAIYGSRASNGVILITTKKGKLGDAIQVNYTGNVSLSRIIETVDVLDADEYRTLIQEQFADGHPARGLLGTANTDWQDQIYQDAWGHDHNLSFSGGIKDVLPYRVSFGFTDRNGVLKTDEFQRTTVGVNLTPGFFDNTLQVKASFKGAFTKNRFANRGAIGSAVSFDPTKPVYDANSPFEGYYTWLDNSGNPNPLAVDNPVAMLNLRDDRSNVKRAIFNFSVDYRLPFLPDLRANLNLASDYSVGFGDVFEPATAAFSFNALTGGGLVSDYTQTKRNELVEFYLNYVKDLGDHRIDLMGGYSWQRFFFEDYSFNSDAAGTASETQEFTSSGELFLLSLFGRLNYSLYERFFLTLSLRRDASSRFSPDNRWGLFPAAALSVKVIDNNSGVLNTLKLRAGYGVTGQQDIGNYYQYLPRYTIGLNNASYQFGNQYVTTLRPEGYDANIKWEETTTYNVGVDFGFFNNRLTGAVDVYLRETTDLLNSIFVPAGTNLTNILATNVGDLENRGVELTLNVIPVQTENTTWDVGFNLTYNENKITKLTASEDPSFVGVTVGSISGGLGNTVQIHTVDYPASSFYLYEQVYNENGIPIEGLYVDQNGDGIINESDLYRTKNPAPKYFFGVNSTLSYKNWDFSFSGRANLGNTIYNNIQSDVADYNRLYNSTNYLLNVHSDISGIQFQVPQFLSDHFIYDGSFFRLDFVSLGYRFQNLFNSNSTLGITATVNNPLLVTDYTGIDPEVFGGIDGNIYPRSRTYVLGFNLSL